MFLFKTIILSFFIGYSANIGIDKFEYSINISATRDQNNIPKSIKIKIVNNEPNEITLRDLVFSFYVEDNGYYGRSKKFGFLPEGLILKSKGKFEKTIELSSLDYVSFIGHENISPREIQKILRKSKLIRITATMSDMRRLQDPLVSSSLSHSNSIEIKK